MQDNMKHITFEEKVDYARAHISAALSYIDKRNETHQQIKSRLDTGLIFLDRALAEFDEKRKEKEIKGVE